LLMSVDAAEVAEYVLANEDDFKRLRQAAQQQALQTDSSQTEPLAGEPQRSPIGTNTRLNALPVAAEPLQPDSAIAQSSTGYNIADDMATHVQNTLIVGKPGSGKGILLSNALRAIQRRSPNTRIVAIDPKGSPDEQGYWQGCYKVFAEETLHWSPSRVAKWVNDCIDDFFQMQGPKLLVVDECKHLSQTLKRCDDKGASFKTFWYRIESFTSMGDATQSHVWCVSQTAHAADLAVTGGTRSMFRAVAIVTGEDVGYVDSLTSTKFIPPPKEGVSYVQELIGESPVSRAFYCSKQRDWFPLMPLSNYSNIDRDRRTRIEPEQNPREQLEAQYQAVQTAAAAPEKADSDESDLYQQVCDKIVELAEKRGDKGITARDVMRSGSPLLRGLNSTDIRDFLDGLVDEDKRLTRSDDRYFFPDSN
ncbi:MAG: hypothetical protein F6K04_23875, partial [Leptolyngbya sp. SIO4C5]|nr:hypothetical protein [Leptolyngbya sp. SIO4C5]